MKTIFSYHSPYSTYNQRRRKRRQSSISNIFPVIPWIILSQLQQIGTKRNVSLLPAPPVCSLCFINPPYDLYHSELYPLFIPNRTASESNVILFIAAIYDEFIPPRFHSIHPIPRQYNSTFVQRFQSSESSFMHW